MPLARHDINTDCCVNATEFLLTCLLRGMTVASTQHRFFLNVSTHMPLARHDASVGLSAAQNMVSTHMPLARHDLVDGKLMCIVSSFYSHASCEAWHERDEFTNYFASFYSHASCEAWLRRVTRNRLIIKVSTHMPLARHDRAPFFCCPWWRVSTHMPLARHDSLSLSSSHILSSFYSHASCEAWHLQQFRVIVDFCFYSHASCEAWRLSNVASAVQADVSTHMPLARHDVKIPLELTKDWSFYSHASCEAWRYLEKLYRELNSFYSHASCEAWQMQAAITSIDYSFYSHASCEAWPKLPEEFRKNYLFLLTCLLRGMTPSMVKQKFFTSFYSHASCEAWRQSRRERQRQASFYSHASCEAWLCRNCMLICQKRFYSHASCEAWL